MYDSQTIALNVVESTCVVDSYTVVDTPRTPAHNTPCPLPWVRDKAVDMEIPTEKCSHDLKKNLIHSIISFVSGFFPDVSAATPISVFSLCSFRFVVFLCKRDCYDGKNEIWSVLQVVVENMTIIWPVLFWSLDDLFRSQNTRRLPISRNAFPINFYRIRVKKYKNMRVLKSKREI